MSIVNLTNHPSAKWEERQREEAEKYGTIIDLPFPNIGAELSEEQIRQLAKDYEKQIREIHPQAVICQGEFTFVYAFVGMLRAQGMKVLSACSERMTTEMIMPDGSTQKTALFKFVRFREYTE